MAFNKKKKRKIVVGEKEYYWSATGDDGWISLCVMTDVQGSPKLLCKFDYHHLPIKSNCGEKDITVRTNQFVITPYTVRQTILYALSIGWKPFEKGKDLDLHHIDDKIDLRLDKNRIVNDKDFWFQFSLYAAGIKNKE
ncbi:MAG: hypothetical protein M3384_19070 [Acidobacteriota bacterium]|nr:hypothetical protein [Acidobacteriota bacterium]